MAVLSRRNVLAAIVATAAAAVVVTGCSAAGTAAAGITAGGTRAAGTAAAPPPSPSVAGAPSSSAAGSGDAAGVAGSVPATSPPECTAADLTVTPGVTQGAVSHSSLVLLFTNSSSAPCVVQGYPGVAAQLPGGQVYNAVRAMAGYMGGDAAPSPAQVPLAPGRTASAVIEWLIAPQDGSASVTPADCAGDGAVGLLVTVPDQTTSTRLAPPDQYSPICWGFEVHPIVAGSTGQYPSTN